MDQLPVWLDCDTGTDDAIAILALTALPGLNIAGISATWGNCCQRDAFLNTHRVCGITGADYPIYPGAEQAIERPLKTSDGFHGKNGLGDIEVPLPPDAVYNTEKAWDALYRAAKEHKGQLRLITTGPLTNIAIAFSKYPDLPELLHSVYTMGGSATHGNVTPAAEFNVYADPHAAELVFQCGVPLYLFGLNATMQAWVTPEDLEEWASTGRKSGIFARNVLQFALRNVMRAGRPGMAMHDSCPVLYLAHPELFTMGECGVHVETRGVHTIGKTVTDLYSDKQFPVHNAMLCTAIDRAGFIAALRTLVLSHE